MMVNKVLDYQKYKSRRNKIITDKKFHSFLSNFSFRNNSDVVTKSKKFINLEIGFGSGEFTLSRARKDRDNIYIASEVYNPGIKTLLTQIEKDNIKNIYIINDDIRDFLDQFSDRFFNNIFIFFPDPWPKRKHHKRRLINQNFFDYISGKFKSHIFIATDHDNYAESVLFDALKCDSIEIRKMKIFNKTFFKTKYEHKAIRKGRNIYCFAIISCFN